MNFLKSLFFVSVFALFSFSSYGQCPASIASLGRGNGLQICWPNNSAPATLTEITYDGITYSGTFVNAGQGDCWRTTQAATIGVNGNHTLEITINGVTGRCQVLDGNFVEVNLPISLAYFGASEVENAVLIEWQTLEEENNDYFEIERSLDGGEFEVIHRVEGAGTTSDMQFYEFEDQEAIYQNGTYYYRLKQVDFDGTTSFSETVAVKIKEAQTFVLSHIFPNPASEQLNLLLNLQNSQNTQIYVIDMNGRTVLEKSVEDGLMGVQRISLNVQALQAGCYFLRIQSGEQAVAKKFIKI